jgi:hypothetical protein
MMHAMSPEREASAERSTWAARDFRAEAAPRRQRFARGILAAAATVVAFVFFLVAITHELTGCGDACYDGGLRSYEDGHAWTAYEGAWQWQAQWGLGLAGLVLALGALLSSGRYAWRWWSAGLLAAAVACDVAYVAWRLLEPAVPS